MARKYLSYADEREIERIQAAARLRKLKEDPAHALANERRRQRTRNRQLLDPNLDRHMQAFPLWVAGMTTAEYLRRFQSLCHTKPVVFAFADRAAPYLNPLEPEVVEIIDAPEVP
jgi:hypothetical protein